MEKSSQTGHIYQREWESSEGLGPRLVYRLTSWRKDTATCRLHLRPGMAAPIPVWKLPVPLILKPVKPSVCSVQELGRLQMKSQLEGAGLGLPLQGGAQGHNPGIQQPRREDAFCKGAEGKHTQQHREGGTNANSS